MRGKEIHIVIWRGKKIKKKLEEKIQLYRKGKKQKVKGQKIRKNDRERETL